MFTWRFDLAWGTHGNGPGQFQSPSRVAANTAGTRVYVTDDLLNYGQIFDADGNFISKFGDSGSGILADPFFVSVSVTNGDVYVADHGHKQVVQFDSTGSYIRKWGTDGVGNGQFKDVEWVVVSSDGAFVYAGDSTRNDIQKFTAAGVFVSVWLTGACDINAAPDDTYWIVEGSDFHHRASNATNIATFPFPPLVGELFTGDESPYKLYLVSRNDDVIYVYDQAMNYLATVGSRGSGAGQFTDPLMAAIRTPRMWVADQGNYQVQRWSLTDLSLQAGPPVIHGRGAC